jgi:GMP synthase-like glutamine amidotransferase
MRIYCLQHVSFEGPGCIGQWIAEKGHELHIIHLYLGEALPQVNDVDLLVIMGGPMNVDDEQLHPFLGAEKAFIRRCIDAGKTVLGLCLGSQLIARAMDKPVFPNGEKEIGWLPVVRNQNASHETARLFPESLTCFHWHGDTFELPEGAVLLASSKACTNQAYLLNETVLGLQFHPEATTELVENMLLHESGELVTGRPYVQVADDIRKGLTYATAANDLMFALLDYLEAKTINHLS